MCLSKILNALGYRTEKEDEMPNRRFSDYDYVANFDDDSLLLVSEVSAATASGFRTRKILQGTLRNPFFVPVIGGAESGSAAPFTLTPGVKLDKDNDSTAVAMFQLGSLQGISDVTISTLFNVQAGSGDLMVQYFATIADIDTDSDALNSGGYEALTISGAAQFQKKFSKSLITDLSFVPGSYSAPFIGLDITRNSDDAGDTYSGDIYVLGFIIEYTYE